MRRTSSGVAVVYVRRLSRGRHEPLVAPPAALFDEAGLVLRALRLAGREVRRASLVNDAPIALTARRVGAAPGEAQPP